MEATRLMAAGRQRERRDERLRIPSLVIPPMISFPSTRPHLSTAPCSRVRVLGHIGKGNSFHVRPWETHPTTVPGETHPIPNAWDTHPIHSVVGHSSWWQCHRTHIHPLYRAMGHSSNRQYHGTLIPNSVMRHWSQPQSQGTLIQVIVPWDIILPIVAWDTNPNHSAMGHTSQLQYNGKYITSTELWDSHPIHSAWETRPNHSAIGYSSKPLCSGTLLSPIVPWGTDSIHSIEGHSSIHSALRNPSNHSAMEHSSQLLFFFKDIRGGRWSHEG